ncbi:hypothetical protein MKX01_016504 [Papaver californicum]|nr:hypothetical protein MKX01_016504 [Papaver californicum]
MPPPPPEIDGYENANWSSFQIFFQGWLLRQQHYLDQLLTSANRPQEEVNTLVSQVLSHYQQYYEAKSMVICQDVYIVFAPPWFSPLERTFLWIAGFKPGLAFKILNNSVRDSLSEHQKERVTELMMDTRVAEKELSHELARIQESIVAPPIVDMARLTHNNNSTRSDRNHRDEVDTGLRSLRETMEALVESADFLRMTTARKVVEILNPGQALTFLAAATQLQLKARELGYQRDAELRRRTRSRATTRRT